VKNVFYKPPSRNVLQEIGCFMANIAAIVVAYIPDEKKLLRLLSALSDQVSAIYILDNTPSDKIDWCNHYLIENVGSLFRYVPLGKNYGIAHAQNIGIKFAADEGFKHLIFFDQDSWVPPKLVDGLIESENRLLALGEKVGSIGPLFLDEKSGQYSEAVRYTGFFVRKIKISPMQIEPIESDHIISSGSLIKLDTLKEVGNMQEELFIDLVDTEWCLRAAKRHYKHYINPSTVMIHNIGDEPVKFGSKSINIHSPIRSYYVIRNMTYLLFHSKISWRWRLNCIYKIPRYIWIFICITPKKNKFNIAILLIRAFFSGLFIQLGDQCR